MLRWRFTLKYSFRFRSATRVKAYGLRCIVAHPCAHAHVNPFPFEPFVWVLPLVSGRRINSTRTVQPCTQWSRPPSPPLDRDENLRGRARGREWFGATGLRTAGVHGTVIAAHVITVLFLRGERTQYAAKSNGPCNSAGREKRTERIAYGSYGVCPNEAKITRGKISKPKRRVWCGRSIVVTVLPLMFPTITRRFAVRRSRERRSRERDTWRRRRSTDGEYARRSA